MDENMIAVGNVLKPHGVKGELKVLPLTDDPEARFKKDNIIFAFWNGSLKNFVIEKSNYISHKNIVILKLHDINSVEEAEKFRNTYLKISEEDLLPLEDDKFYHFQLLGLNVYEENGEFLGKIEEIQETGSNDVYIVKNENNNELLIPALKDVVINVDLVSNTMIVKLLPGLR